MAKKNTSDTTVDETVVIDTPVEETVVEPTPVVEPEFVPVAKVKEEEPEIEQVEPVIVEAPVAVVAAPVAEEFTPVITESVTKLVEDIVPGDTIKGFKVTAVSTRDKNGVLQYFIRTKRQCLNVTAPAGTVVVLN